MSAEADRGKLLIALALLLGFMATEVIVGIAVDSLALLSDAAHMLTDAGAIALALLAIRLAQRPAQGAMTYGFKRAEILSAQFNGATLLVLGLLIVYEGIRRLVAPPDVEGAAVLVVALVGVAVNLVATWTLSKADRRSMNIEGAFQHILTDLAAFIATAIAGVIILTTGFDRADGIASLVVAAIMLRAAYGLLRDSGRVFLEAAPEGIDPQEIGRALVGHPAVTEVHDLHVWEVSSGFPALSAHVLVSPDDDCHAARRDLERMLIERFEIEHTTLQVDHTREGELLRVQGVAEAEPSDSTSEQQAFVFADIAGFSALTDALGDRRAVQAAQDFERHTAELLARHGGQRVKTIGDAVMLRVGDAAAAVRVALDLSHHEMARPGHPGVRVGIHYGSAVERSGDWLGSTVNAAARIADLAGAGEVLISARARGAAGELQGVAYDDRGLVRLRNISGEVELFEARCLDEAAALLLDPVCRIALDPQEAAIKTSHDGREYRFCSEGCRQVFVLDPQRHLQELGSR